MQGFKIQGERGMVYVGDSPMVALQQWSMELIEPGRYSFIAEKTAPDITRWPFRDRALPIRVELPMRRSTLWFHVMLSNDSPLSGEATLDANTAEAGEFW